MFISLGSKYRSNWEHVGNYRDKVRKEENSCDLSLSLAFCRTGASRLTSGRGSGVGVGRSSVAAPLSHGSKAPPKKNNN